MKTHILFVLLAIAFVVDVDAGWKFWKKDKNATTTELPPTSSTTIRPTSKVSQPSPKQGIAGLADPALAIGVGKNAAGIHMNAKLNPPSTQAPQNNNRKPGPVNPFEVTKSHGGANRPAWNPNSQNYRDWAVQLTGAGEPGSPIQNQPNQPKVSTNAPAKSTPGASSTARPVSPTHKPREEFPQLPQRGGSSLPMPTGSPQTPNGSKSFADIAKNGNRPSSPTITSQQNKIGPTGPTHNSGHPIQGKQQPLPSPKPQVANGPRPTYSANPMFSKGKTVTDDDLEKLSEALFIKDNNNAYQYIKLNLQKQTSSNSPKDEAPQPLLTVNSSALQIPTIQRVLSIYDNYKLDTREHEYISPSQREEESLLVDTFLSTNVMAFAMRFLADKGFVRKEYYDYKDLLRKIWFNLYSRNDGKIGSSGFEHVFLTELKLGSEVSGLHNWIYFNAEELKNRLDYLGYIKKLDLGDKAAIVKVHIKFNGIDKPVSNIFIGTSPELEMALYTVCFLTRPDQSCPVSLGGSKFTILTHKFRYRGNDLIGSAYPQI